MREMFEKQTINLRWFRKYFNLYVIGGFTQSYHGFAHHSQPQIEGRQQK